MYSYFKLTMSNRVRRPLSIIALPQKYQRVIQLEAFEQLDQAIVAYFSADAREEVPAILNEPSFLINDELKRLFNLYMPEMKAKMIQLFAGEKDNQESHLYWLPYFEPMKCLHKSTERYPDGSIKNIILDQDFIPETPLFRVGGILEHRIIVEISVAESILRRSPYGIDITPVEVR